MTMTLVKAKSQLLHHWCREQKLHLKVVPVVSSFVVVSKLQPWKNPTMLMITCSCLVKKLAKHFIWQQKKRNQLLNLIMMVLKGSIEIWEMQNGLRTVSERAVLKVPTDDLGTSPVSAVTWNFKNRFDPSPPLEVQFRWLENSVMKIGKAVSNPLMSNHLKWNSS